MAHRILLPSVISAIVIAGALGIYFAYDAERQNLEDRQEVLMPEESVFSVDGTALVSLEGTQQLKKFSSEENLREFLRNAPSYDGTPRFMLSASLDRAVSLGIQSDMWDSPTLEYVDSTTTSAKSDDFSSTNIQTAGVDEPDFLKTDGKYIYIVKDTSLVIVDAYPADEAEIAIKVALDIEQQNLQNMFLNGDRLAVFYHGSASKETIPEFQYEPIEVYAPVTHVMILDVSDKESPMILNDYQVDGNFRDARMIGDFVYFISTAWIDHRTPTIPHITDSASNVVIRPDVFYFDNPEPHYEFNTITAINLFDESFVNSNTFLTSPASTIYASHNGFYIAYERNMHHSYYDEIARDRFFDVIVPLLPASTHDAITSIDENDSIDSGQKWNQVSALLQETYDEMSSESLRTLFDEIELALAEYDSKVWKDSNKTVIHKILVDEGSLKYHANGEVSGWLLNQFSMDEYGDRFRVATTNERVTFEGRSTYSSVYVLDSNDLNIVGSIEGLAPNESIFSTRFMGERLYMVTFEIIDPFFVIDLSTDQPRVLGELKIPGFSNYLHMYDEDHVIGIGRDTKEDSGRVQQLGVKIALFDVSDVKNPAVLDDVVIGNSHAYSAALHNHKAFLFDKNKNVLSIPIEGPAQTLLGSDDAIRNGEYRWYGFYVYGLDVQDGFDLRGKIDHSESMHLQPSLSRSLYIDDVLYTVSANLIKMNDLDVIENEINSIDLGPKGQIIEYLK